MTLELRFRLLSLYTFPDFYSGLGSGLSYLLSEDFPDFKRFYIRRFRLCTQIFDVFCTIIFSKCVTVRA